MTQKEQPQTREGGERMVRHMTIPEHARAIAANWVYGVFAWRGRSPQFMQGQVLKLAEEIAAAQTIAYEAGADALRAAGQQEQPRERMHQRAVREKVCNLSGLVEASRNGFLDGQPYILTYSDIITELSEIEAALGDTCVKPR